MGSEGGGGRKHLRKTHIDPLCGMFIWIDRQMHRFRNDIDFYIYSAWHSRLDQTELDRARVIDFFEGQACEMRRALQDVSSGQDVSYLLRSRVFPVYLEPSQEKSADVAATRFTIDDQSQAYDYISSW